MPANAYPAIVAVLLVATASGSTYAEPEAPDAERTGATVETKRTSIGVTLGRDWFPPEGGASEAPRANYLGIWVLRDLTPRLALGLGGSASVNPFGCDDDERCQKYRLQRIGAIAEVRLPLVQQPLQGLEIFGSVGPELVRTSEPGDQRIADATPWGFGATGRIGPRVRMRWLTVAPYGEFAAFSVGTHVAYGFGLQLGVLMLD